MPPKIPLNYRTEQLFLMLADAAVFNIAVLLGLVARFEGRIPAQYLQQYAGPLGVLQTAIAIAGFAFAGMYVRIVRYSSINDLLSLLVGCGISLASFLALTGTAMGRGFPRSVAFIAVALTFLLAGGFRVMIRLAVSQLKTLPARLGRARKRVLVIGAGDAGSLVVNELKGRLHADYDLVGLVDDDPGKQGLRLHGSPVLGRLCDTNRLVKELTVDEVLVAIPSANTSVMRRVYGLCEGTGVRLRTVPGLYELINGHVKIDAIRNVDIEDLLARRSVDLSVSEIAGYIAGRSVMVTGAGGSIGSELCRQIARYHPARLVLFDHDENAVFELHHELAHGSPKLEMCLVVGDVRHMQKVCDAFERHTPLVVFHAAAYKHVPLMEDHPEQAVKTNIFGTYNIASAASIYGANRFVLVSTDKAVNPASVMGATKAVAEQVTLAFSEGWDPVKNCSTASVKGSPCRYMCVRFGNVMGSRGSVVPLFKEQIRRGGPVTVTHPDMKRYFMTIPEAAQLVIQAGAIGKGGEVFVLDMGKPVRIVELAETLIRLSGYEPGEDIQIMFIGPRKGEKICEQIFSGDEEFDRTSHPMILVARNSRPEGVPLSRCLASLEQACFRSSTIEPAWIRDMLQKAVPAYRPWVESPEAAIAASQVASGEDTRISGLC